MGNNDSSYDIDPTLTQPTSVLTTRLTRLEQAKGNSVDSARPAITPRTQSTVLRQTLSTEGRGPEQQPARPLLICRPTRSEQQVAQVETPEPVTLTHTQRDGQEIKKVPGLPFSAEPSRQESLTKGSGPKKILVRPLSTRKPTLNDQQAAHVSRPEPVTLPDSQKDGQEIKGVPVLPFSAEPALHTLSTDRSGHKQQQVRPQLTSSDKQVAHISRTKPLMLPDTQRDRQEIKGVPELPFSAEPARQNVPPKGMGPQTQLAKPLSTQPASNDQQAARVSRVMTLPNTQRNGQEIKGIPELPVCAEPALQKLPTGWSKPGQQQARPLSTHQPAPNEQQVAHVSRPEPVRLAHTQRDGQEIKRVPELPVRTEPALQKSPPEKGGPETQLAQPLSTHHPALKDQQATNVESRPEPFTLPATQRAEQEIKVVSKLPLPVEHPHQTLPTEDFYSRLFQQQARPLTPRRPTPGDPRSTHVENRPEPVTGPHTQRTGQDIAGAPILPFSAAPPHQTLPNEDFYYCLRLFRELERPLTTRLPTPNNLRSTPVESRPEPFTLPDTQRAEQEIKVVSRLPLSVEHPRQTPPTEDFYSGLFQQQARPLTTRLPTPNNLRSTPVESRPEPVTWLHTQRDGQERCYDPNDTRFTFVDGEDDMDFLWNEYKSLRAKMSCGHTVTPSSLIDWCCSQLEEGKTEFVCGQPGCNAVWSCDEVFEMALLTPEEIEYIEKKLFEKAAKAYLDVKKCPGCNSLALREDTSDVRVRCTVCTQKKGKLFEFCWLCLREWKRPSLYPDRCAEPDCVGKPETVLRTCPEIIFKVVKNVKGCPSIRACPTCGFLLEHNKNKCKNIVCSRCRVKFCFVCLKLTRECEMTSTCYFPCSAGVAPRQTSIPVWHRNLAGLPTPVQAPEDQ